MSRRETGSPGADSVPDAGGGSGGVSVALVAIGLVVLVAVAFARTCFARFISLDDEAYVVGNAWVQRGLTLDGFAWAWTTSRESNWHPLVWLSLMLDRTLFGPEPVGFHAVNVALHAVNTALLFVALRSLTGEVRRPALAAALWGLHPLRAESVAWVAERKDVLSGLFWILAVWAYGVSRRTGSRGAWLGCVAALAAGLASKQILVTLPCVLLLLDAWPLGRGKESPVRLVVEKWFLFALVGAACAVAVWAQASGGSIAQLEAVPLSERVRNATTCYGLYLVHFVWPVPLAVFYPRGYADFGWVGALVSAAGLAAISLVLWRIRSRNPAPWIGWLWYLGTFVPVIGLVQIGQQALADRYTYVPMMGLSLAVAWLLPARPAWGARSGRAWIMAVVAVIALGGLTVWQTGYWMDSRGLFARCLEVTSRNHVAHFLYGRELLQAGDEAAAFSHFGACRQLDSNSIYGAQAWIVFGRRHAARQELERAEECYRAAVRQSPNLSAAHRALGDLLVDTNRLGEGIEVLERAVRTDPESFVARHSLGYAYLRRGDVERATAELERAVELDPQFAPSLRLLERIRQSRGE